MRLICLSDTHNRTDALSVPDGDVLVVAGDFCGYGADYEVEKFHEFLADLPHKHKVAVAGNHDWPFTRVNSLAVENFKKAFTYLEDSGCEIEGFKFWGSPWQPEFYNWAFNLPRGEALAKKWRKIPTDTDVLITHGPPFGILDYTETGVSVGCEDLAAAVLHRIKPMAHIFGHIHNARGVEYRGHTTFVNACICTERYRPDNQPIVIDI